MYDRNSKDTKTSNSVSLGIPKTAMDEIRLELVNDLKNLRAEMINKYSPEIGQAEISNVIFECMSGLPPKDMKGILRDKVIKALDAVLAGKKVAESLKIV